MPSTEEPARSKARAFEKPTGTWAAEAFDFLRLFSRVGGSFIGLVLLQIGWAIALGLVRNLSAEDATPILGVPWPSAAGWTIRDVRLSSAYFVGALLVGLVWSLISGFYLYLWYPLLKLLRLFAGLLLQVLIFPILLVVFAVTLPLWLVESFLITRWKRKQPPEKLAELEDTRQKDPNAYLETMHQEMGFDAWWLGNQVVSVFDDMLAALSSVGRIGLAPIYGYTFEEDLNAAKVPGQMFTSAASRLRTRFSTLVSLERADFQTLPALFKVTTARRARWARRWLDLDTVLWGSYLSTDPPRIWLNIERPPTKRLRRKEEPGLLERLDPFFNTLDKWDPEMLVVDQSDPLDAYITLVITLIQSLKARRPRMLYLLKAWRQANEKEISVGRLRRHGTFEHLITDVLTSIDAPLAPEVLYPTAKSVLVDLTGRWIAVQLSTRSRSRDKAASYESLLDIALRCVQLRPDVPDHHYRLAVLQLAFGKTDEAFSTLTEANAKQSFLYEVDKIHLEVVAKMAYQALTRTRAVASSRERRINLAKAIVCTNRAIAAGEDEAKQGLRKDLEETHYFALYRLVLEPRSDIVDLHRLLYRVLGLTESTGETQGVRPRAAARIRPPSRRQD